LAQAVYTVRGVRSLTPISRAFLVTRVDSNDEDICAHLSSCWFTRSHF